MRSRTKKAVGTRFGKTEHPPEPFGNSVGAAIIGLDFGRVGGDVIEGTVNMHDRLQVPPTSSLTAAR